jgi:single-strand DNA-binding protein
MNAFNCVHLVGRIPKTDKIKYDFHEATNDNGTNARMNGSLSVQRSRKPEGEQYYPEDLIPFVAFGKTAEFMNNYVHLGDVIAIEGELEANTVENDEGERRTFYSVRIDSVRKLPRSTADETDDSDDDDDDEEEEKPKKTVKKSNGNPFSGKKKADGAASAKKKSPFSKK